MGSRHRGREQPPARRPRVVIEKRAQSQPAPAAAGGARWGTVKFSGSVADVAEKSAPVLFKNPIDAVRRADSTLDARRVATFVTAESHALKRIS